MNKKNDTINRTLHHLILDRSGSIRQFAIMAKIERTQIYPILRGEALPGLRNFVSMAKTLALDLDELADLLDVDPRKAGKE